MTRRSQRSRQLANRIWLSTFGVWLILLSGVLAGILGSPGIIQAVRLNNLLSEKRANVDRLETEIEGLQTEAAQLTTSRAAQQREIRKTLGYAGEDELIFDFSADSADFSDSSQSHSRHF